MPDLGCVVDSDRLYVCLPWTPPEVCVSKVGQEDWTGVE